jgi:N-acetylglucosamine kinase-like BadF-type ATPase
MNMTNLTHDLKGKRLLICDGGSTKMQWIYLTPDEGVKNFVYPGLNPMTASDADFKHSFLSLKGELNSQPEFVGYYGAGCSTPEVCGALKSVLLSIFGENIAYEVGSDMLLAAQAATASAPGLVFILGTGSNSCYFDGEKCISKVPSLGYILGDEGSGTYIGKKLIKHIFRPLAPQSLKQLFFEETDISYSSLLTSVYKNGSPAKFLACLTEFVSSHINDANEVGEYLCKLVEDSFREFFNEVVELYSVVGIGERNLYFVGSIAHFFAAQLTTIATERGYQVKQIIRKPIEGIVKNYLKENSYE